MSDPAPSDEYVVTYRHLGKRLNVLFWQSTDDDGNRLAALRHAARTATSMDVDDVRVARRPKAAWEPLNWRQETANSAPSSYDEHMASSGAEA